MLTPQETAKFYLRISWWKIFWAAGFALNNKPNVFMKFCLVFTSSYILWVRIKLVCVIILVLSKKRWVKKTSLLNRTLFKANITGPRTILPELRISIFLANFLFIKHLIKYWKCIIQEFDKPILVVICVNIWLSER